jgi:phage FluMu protein Com
MGRKYTCLDCGKPGKVDSVQGPLPKRCPDCKRANAAKAAKARYAGGSPKPAAAPKGDAGKDLGASVATSINALIERKLAERFATMDTLEARIKAVVDARLRAAAEQIAKAARG